MRLSIPNKTHPKLNSAEAGLDRKEEKVKNRMNFQELFSDFPQYLWNYLSELNEILEFVNVLNEKTNAVWSLKKY